jgi:hypothetical protein
MAFNLRNGSFLKEIDFEPRELRFLFAATDTAWAPWFVTHSDDKKRARLNVITHLLDRIPCEPLPSQQVTLPKRKIHEVAGESGNPVRYIPTPY